MTNNHKRVCVIFVWNIRPWAHNEQLSHLTMLVSWVKINPILTSRVWGGEALVLESQKTFCRWQNMNVTRAPDLCWAHRGRLSHTAHFEIHFSVKKNWKNVSYISINLFQWVFITRVATYNSDTWSRPEDTSIKPARRVPPVPPAAFVSASRAERLVLQQSRA